jgi:RNA-binding protein 39
VDIQLIRDTRTLKSKGLAYVEFEDRRSVPHALALSGRNLNGYPVLVQMTQAERGVPTPPTLVNHNPAGNDKQGILLVKHINGRLSQDDITPIFNAFGEVRSIQVEDGEGPNEKTALVEFRRNGEAATAMTQLNGLEVVGFKLEISFASNEALSKSKNPEVEMRTARFEDESGNGGVVMSLQDKQSLMNNLAKRAGLAVPDQNPYAGIPKAKQEKTGGPPKASQCLLLTNMFDPSKETDPDFDLEIREDVREEVSAHGRLVHIYVDKTSKEGRIYLKFESPATAQKAHVALDGRWFAQNRIVANYMDPVEYAIQFPGV